MMKKCVSEDEIDEMANDNRLNALAMHLAIQAGNDWCSLSGEERDTWNERAIEHLRSEGLRCDTNETCTEPVTHIDNKGFTYCAGHGVVRRSSHPCRKLRTHELRKLQRGETIKRY